MKNLFFSLVVLAVFQFQILAEPDYEINFEYRFRRNFLADIPVGPDNELFGQRISGENRLRLSPYFKFSENLKIGAEADFLTGLNFGDSPSVDFRYAEIPRNNHEGIEKVDFRQLYVEWKFPYGLLKAGQFTSSWGLGIMANAGENTNMFGDSYYGDLVDRIEIITKPFKAFSEGNFADNFYIAFGGDFVYRDDLGSVLEGDKAIEGIFAGLYRTEPFSAGFYIAYRNQKDNQGNGKYEVLEGTGYDIYINGNFSLTENLDLTLSGEGVILSGRTTLLRTYDYRNGVKVLSGGSAGRIGLKCKRTGIAGIFEAGFASGDGDLNDGTLYQYRFDPDYNVGLILFDEVLNAISAFSAERAYNVEIVGNPPPGTPLLPTNGSVSNAYYFFPALSYSGIENMQLNLGVLFARAVKDIIDPFFTMENGGSPRTFLNTLPPSRDLGYEIDLGGQYTRSVKKFFDIILGVQMGEFHPGKFFTDINGERFEPVYKVQGRITIKR